MGLPQLYKFDCFEHVEISQVELLNGTRMKSELFYGIFVLIWLQHVMLIVWGSSTEAPGPEDDNDDNNETDENGIFVGNLSLCQNVANRVFLPYVGDCRKYYLCWDGKAIQKQCKKDYQFNARNQSCGYPNKAKCLPTCDSDALKTFGYDRTCTQYVICYYGIPVLRECRDGLQYNAETDRCDFPQYVDCVDSECMRLPELTQLIFIPSKASCSKYYICAHGVPENYTCTEGLHFSTDCDCCDYPKKAKCEIPAVRRNIQPYSRSPLRKADAECPAQGVHFYAHRNRRDAYIYCVNGHGLILECTPGLWYDPNSQECREPKYLL